MIQNDSSGFISGINQQLPSDALCQKYDAAPPKHELDILDAPQEKTSEHLVGLRLIVVMVSLLFTVFLTALDETIIATAIPTITNEFESFNDVGWFGSAYFLTSSSTIILYVKIYNFFPAKWGFLAAIAIFEMGSLVCGVAPSSIVFIFGRAITGFGCAGINSGCQVILSKIVPLQKRSIYAGLLEGAYGIASVTGPLLGGAFTSRLSWRWCFYINIPIGVVAAIMVGLLFGSSPPENMAANASLKKKLLQVDFLGFVVFICAMISLLLVLQWGGLVYQWADTRIIVLIVVFAVLMATFLFLQHRRKEFALLPPRIVCKRSVCLGACYIFLVNASLSLFDYYLPIWFQAIHGSSALDSGTRTVPLVIAYVSFSIFTGLAISKVGFYTPFMLLGSIFLTVGAGMVTTATLNTSRAEWIGYQILLGLGIGLGMLQSYIATQTVLDDADLPTGLTFIVFAQFLGSTISISTAQNILTNRLISNMRVFEPGINPSILLSMGITQLRASAGPSQLQNIVSAYKEALQITFFFAVATSGISFFAATGMEWRSVKKGGENADRT